MYGAKPATSMSTTPVTGSLIDFRSASMGAETWAVASRKITTSTTLDRIRAITKPAHLPAQLRVWSQLDPDRAMGANTMATNRRALRIRRLIHTITAAPMASTEMKIVTMTATPGAGIAI